jgi:phospholipase C
MANEWTERARELTARRMERRSFLRGALGVSGLALMNGAGLARAALRRPATAGLPFDPKTSGLDVIVTTMMENRSTDHFFGWIHGIDGIQEGFVNPAKLDYSGSNPCPRETPFAVGDPTPVAAHRSHTHCDSPDPDHGWFGSRVELNRGNLDGFADRSGKTALGYHTQKDIPFLGWLGAEYTTFSRYFSSVLGPTYPNRLYWLSAQGGTAKTNALPTPTAQNPAPTGYRWNTIFDRLSAAGVEWAYYATDLPSIWLFFRHNYLDPGRIRHITEYYEDARLGRLPSVVFLDPSFITVANDYHPAHDIRLAERYVQDTFLALAEGPQWSKSAYILTFDEAGGFYDHVPPPRAPDFRENADHCEDWGQLGFRVPTVVASPFARRRFVGERQYDHTSILKLIEWRFSLPSLTPRDAAANNIGEVLDFESRETTLPAGMPFIPLHVAGLGCSQNALVEAFEGENPLEPIPDIPIPHEIPKPFLSVGHEDMRALADSGWFGRYDFRERARHGVFRD